MQASTTFGKPLHRKVNGLTYAISALVADPDTFPNVADSSKAILSTFPNWTAAQGYVDSECTLCMVC